MEHPEGDRLLADYVLSADGARKLLATAVLGDLDGSDGLAALRRITQTTGPGSRDLRCASLLALAKRCGAEASEELTQALSDRDGAVKDYAVIGLAGACRHAVGDRRFVDETYVKVSDRWHYLYRATDQFGQVVDVLLSDRRDGAAARRFFSRAMTTTQSPTAESSPTGPGLA